MKEKKKELKDGLKALQKKREKYKLRGQWHKCMKSKKALKPNIHKKKTPREEEKDEKR